MAVDRNAFIRQLIADKEVEPFVITWADSSAADHKEAESETVVKKYAGPLGIDVTKPLPPHADRFALLQGEARGIVSRLVTESDKNVLVRKNWEDHRDDLVDFNVDDPIDTSDYSPRRSAEAFRDLFIANGSWHSHEDRCIILQRTVRAFEKEAEHEALLAEQNRLLKEMHDTKILLADSEKRRKDAAAEAIELEKKVENAASARKRMNYALLACLLLLLAAVGYIIYLRDGEDLTANNTETVDVKTVRGDFERDPAPAGPVDNPPVASASVAAVPASPDASGEPASVTTTTSTVSTPATSASAEPPPATLSAAPAVTTVPEPAAVATTTTSTTMPVTSTTTSVVPSSASVATPSMADALKARADAAWANARAAIILYNADRNNNANRASAYKAVQEAAAASKASNPGQSDAEKALVHLDAGEYDKALAALGSAPRKVKAKQQLILEPPLAGASEQANQTSPAEVRRSDYAAFMNQ